jgi:GTP cyclohydrolase II
MNTGECVRFDDPDCVGIERGLAEFRAGRPVILRASGRGHGYVTLPVDGLDARRLSVFLGFCRPALPQLVITRRRAAAMNINASGAVALTLGAADLETIRDLVCKPHNSSAFPAGRAQPALAAALDLAKLAQRLPAVLAIEEPADAIFDPPVVAINAGAIDGFRAMAMRSVSTVAETRVELETDVTARFVVFRSALGDSTAVVIGQPDFTKPVLVRLHSACLTGDVFGSRRCDCGDQLRLAMGQLAAAGGGIILYLDQEGRGLGLANKMRAYRLQDTGLDTVDADMVLGFDDDERDYGIAARMLQLLGCERIELLTNNPAKLHGLARYGITISARRPLLAPVNGANRRYLTTKALRAGHALDYLVRSVGGRTPS